MPKANDFPAWVLRDDRWLFGIGLAAAVGLLLIAQWGPKERLENVICEARYRGALSAADTLTVDWSYPFRSAGIERNSSAEPSCGIRRRLASAGAANGQTPRPSHTSRYLYGAAVAAAVAIGLGAVRYLADPDHADASNPEGANRPFSPRSRG
jgi:hypothetical protein